MPFTPRRVAAATITVVALGTGAAPALAGASTPAPASARTPLATTIAKVTPYVRERVNLKQGRAVAELRIDAKQCKRFAAVVAGVHADRAQRAAQLDWVTGVRLQAVGDKQLVAGLLANAKGVTAAGSHEVRAGLAKLGSADHYVGYADELLAGDASGPAPKLP